MGPSLRAPCCPAQYHRSAEGPEQHWRCAPGGSAVLGGLQHYLQLWRTAQPDTCDAGVRQAQLTLSASNNCIFAAAIAGVLLAGGGRTRGRGHRNYFEDSLSLAASVAAELINGCPAFGAAAAACDLAAKNSCRTQLESNAATSSIAEPM